MYLKRSHLLFNGQIRVHLYTVVPRYPVRTFAVIDMIGISLQVFTSARSVTRDLVSPPLSSNIHRTNLSFTIVIFDSLRMVSVKQMDVPILLFFLEVE